MEAYEKVHVWIGSCFKSEDDYQSYFEIDNSTFGDLDGPDYKVCGFCLDIGELWYDQDFIGVIPRFADEVELGVLLAEAAVSQSELTSVLEKCAEYGIEKANALFWYADGNLVVSQPYKDDYDGLRYLGVFDGD